MTVKRTLLVIGGHTGVGAAIARMADQQGHWIPYISDFDVRDQPDVDAFFASHTSNDPANLDIIYCAGINHLGKLGSLDMSDVMDHYAVNVAGFINVMNAAAKSLAGVRVNVTVIVSDSSRNAMRGSVMYASSKAALAHAIRCLAREMAPNWRINGVSPGVIADTPMTNDVDSIVPGLRGWTREEAWAYEKSLVPMGRRALKDEVAELVLSATRGPEYMTGSIIEITGGK